MFQNLSVKSGRSLQWIEMFKSITLVSFSQICKCLSIAEPILTKITLLERVRYGPYITNFVLNLYKGDSLD